MNRSKKRERDNDNGEHAPTNSKGKGRRQRDNDDGDGDGDGDDQHDISAHSLVQQVRYNTMPRQNDVDVSTFPRHGHKP